MEAVKVQAADTSPPGDAPDDMDRGKDERADCDCGGGHRPGCCPGYAEWL